MSDVIKIILYYFICIRMEKGAVCPCSTVLSSPPCSRTSCPSPSSSHPRTKVPAPYNEYLAIIVTDDTEGRRCIDRRLSLLLLYDPVSIPYLEFMESSTVGKISEFMYFYPKKWFLSSRKYDLGCSSRIRDPVWSLDPESGMGNKSGFGFGMNNPDHISERLETTSGG